MYNLKSIDALEKILGKLEFSVAKQSRETDRYERTDKYLQKESDNSTATLAGEHATALGDKSKIRNTEIPITFIYKETAQAFMTGTFLTGYPIFPAIAPREHEDAAAQLTSLSARDQQRFGWAGNLQRCNDDALRYNICAAEVLWTTKRATSAVTKINDGVARSGQASPIIYEGNKIKRIDPYNLFWDPNVEPSKVHEEGTFVGYIEELDYIKLKTRYLDWNELYIIKKNIAKVIQGEKFGHYNNFYYKPTIRKAPGNKAGGEDWQSFWGNNPTHNMTGSLGRYELVTIYVRLIPKEYLVTEVPNSGNPQVYKLIWVNGNLAYAEPVVSGHEYLPLVIGQFHPGDSDVKSFTEYLQDLQDLATALMTGTLDSMRRAVGDRAIYDPTKIRKQDIENPNPTAKIPITSNVYGATNLDSIFKHIPYNDNISGQFAATMNTTMGLAEQTTGINRSAQGNFIKGNKTQMEFDTIMSNSQARLQLGAINLDNSFYVPIKEILKLNYLIYSTNEEVDNRQNGTVVNIDPVMLRQVAPDFKMADGILPSTKIANTEVMIQSLSAMSMDPMLAMEYDTGGIILSILKSQGFTDVDKYRRTPEQMQQRMNMMAAQAGAPANGTPTPGPAAGPTAT